MAQLGHVVVVLSGIFYFVLFCFRYIDFPIDCISLHSWQQYVRVQNMYSLQRFRKHTNTHWVLTSTDLNKLRRTNTTQVYAYNTSTWKGKATGS